MNYAISLARDYDANMEVLKALSGTNLAAVTIGVPNEALAHVASSQDPADKWFRDHTLSVGNDAISGVVQSIVQQAIGNLYNTVRKTAVGDKVRGSSSPPSAGQFANGVDKIINNLTVICTEQGPLY